MSKTVHSDSPTLQQTNLQVFPSAPKSRLDDQSPSSIQPSTNEQAFLPSLKPTLEPPIFTAANLLQTVQELEESNANLMQCSHNRIDQQITSMYNLNHHEIEKIKKCSEYSQKTDSWSFLRESAELILTASSTVLGLSLLTSSPIIGGALIISGILSITNFACKQTGSWEWLARQIAKEDEVLYVELSRTLPIAVGLLAAVIGIGGTVSAAHFIKELNFAQKIITIAQVATTITTNLTLIGQKTQEAFKTWAESDLIHIQSSRQFIQLDLRSAVTAMQEFCKIQSTLMESLSKLTAAKIRAIHITNQIV